MEFGPSASLEWSYVDQHRKWGSRIHSYTTDVNAANGGQYKNWHSDIRHSRTRLCYCGKLRESIGNSIGTSDKNVTVKSLCNEVWILTESYKRVQLEPRELSMSRSTYSLTRECVRAGWKRSRSWFAVWSPNAAKHGRLESARKGSTNVLLLVIVRLPFCISSTRAVGEPHTLKHQGCNERATY